MSDQRATVRVGGKALVALYLFLHRREQELDEHLLAVLADLESTLYDHLSIEEMEQLDEIYGKGIDILARSRGSS